MPSQLHVLVVDDNAEFVEALVAAFETRDVVAAGCSKPWEILNWSKRDEFDFDLILLDMRLGPSPTGDELHAHKLLPHLMTYAPSSKVVVFSQHDITVKECLRCIELGALTVIPKSVRRIEELCLVGEVYQRIGDAARTRQELIDVLWDDVNSSTQGREERLEMLVINLFNSMPTFNVIGHNVETRVGEIDVLVENDNRHPFWRTLKSLHLVIECKHEKHPPKPDVFSQLTAVVKTQGKYSKTGIVVSMSGFTSTFRRRQNDVRCVDGINLLGLGREHLERLVGLQFDKREEYLRSVLQQQ
jgi:CheY-like chemotaxis protein